MTPYYDEDGITIYHGDSLLLSSWARAHVLVTDPPYGIDYRSGRAGVLPRSIANDKTTRLRDTALHLWHLIDADRPALVFGTWRRPRPAATRAVLVWDTKGALGMGDLTMPWKPSHQEIYVLGRGFSGRRTSDVLVYPPVQSMATNGRTHPHEKPVELLGALIAKCPPGVIADPFMGTGSTLIAAKKAGRPAVGVEIEEQFCEVAARRLAQGVFDLFTPVDLEAVQP